NPELNLEGSATPDSQIEEPAQELAGQFRMDPQVLRAIHPHYKLRVGEGKAERVLKMIRPRKLPETHLLLKTKRPAPPAARPIFQVRKTRPVPLCQ
ncbi:MAG: hypothetical protein ACXVC0_02955, partial [Bdellovibrionota bacterium]